MPSPAISNRSASTPPLPRFDRFEVETILGRGAHGTVYLATDTHLQRRVAIKTLNGKTDPSADEKQLMEARMVSGLQQPNIVTLFDAQQQVGGTYPVFEYIEGSTLQKLIRARHRLPVIEAVNLAIDVARAIGLIYADQQTKFVNIDQADLQLLPTLRSQASMAIRSIPRGKPRGIDRQDDHLGWADEACPPLIMTPQAAGNSPEEIKRARLTNNSANDAMPESAERLTFQQSDH